MFDQWRSEAPSPDFNGSLSGAYLQYEVCKHLAGNMFFLSFALALWWSLVFSAGLGFVLVPLMDPDWSWGAGREGRRGIAETGGPRVCDLRGGRGRREEVQSSGGSGSTCAGQWQPVKLN